MIAVRLCVKAVKNPPKLTLAASHINTVDLEIQSDLADRTGVALFGLSAGTGKILV